MDAVLALSGGMDSTTLLALTRRRSDINRIRCVSFDYGSRHARREIHAARQVVEFYQGRDGLYTTHEVVRMPNIFHTPHSALMSDETEMPRQTYEELMSGEGPSPTVVPFRNANIISALTTIAVVADAGVVLVGMHATDAHNWAYPDCTPEFLGAMAAAVWVGSYHKVRLEFPFIWNTKDEIAYRAQTLHAPLHLSYSCYMGGEEHCGTCPTCIERYHAFNMVGLPTESDWRRWVVP